MNETEIFERVAQRLRDLNDRGVTEISSTTDLRDDLGLNSLDAVDLVLEIEDEFEIELPDEEITALASVADVVRAVSTRVLESDPDDT